MSKGLRMTPEQFAAAQKRRVVAAATVPAQTPKQSKYKNKKTVVSGIMFDSKKEAQRYIDLVALINAGLVRDLNLQRPYAITINNMLVCEYVADFVYGKMVPDGTWVTVVEDAKGMKTAEYRLKKKLMKAVLGIEIQEV